jgi:hypothetical protein
VHTSAQSPSSQIHIRSRSPDSSPIHDRFIVDSCGAVPGVAGGIDHGEPVTIPSLHDGGAWGPLEAVAIGVGHGDDHRVAQRLRVRQIDLGAWDASRAVREAR